MPSTNGRRQEGARAFDADTKVRRLRKFVRRARMVNTDRASKVLFYRVFIEVILPF